MTDHRARLGAAGERFAADWLRRRGLSIIARNVELEMGEIDLLAMDGKRRVAVEVRATTGDGDPIDAIDHAKRGRVMRLGAMAGASRVDFVGVAFGELDVAIHWVPGQSL